MSQENINIDYTEHMLWPTKVGFFELGESLEPELKELYDFTISCVEGNLREGTQVANAEERRVHNILDIDTAFAKKIRKLVVECAQHYVGAEVWNQMSPVEICNRAIVLEDRAFINTHVDNREGHVTAVLWVTGNGGSHDIGGNGEAINTADGNPAFKLEDPSRYLDEHRLPWESRHSFRINPKPGLLCFFPSHLPHNGHPYVGDKPHVQIPIGFTFSKPADIEQEPGNTIDARDYV